jgi:hypothetical protein
MTPATNQHKKMKTIAQSTIELSSSAVVESAAAKNGMTTDQMAAAMYVQSIAAHLSPEAKAVLGNKELALAALARVAALPIGEDHAELRTRIQAAILA